MTNNEEQIAAKLSSALYEQFKKVKGWYALENDAEVIRSLIRDKYRELFPKEK